MNGNGSKIVTIVAVLVVVLGIGAASYALLSGAGKAKRDTTDTENRVTMDGPANKDYKAPDPLLPTIVFTDDGFSQDTYTFPAGTAIRVDNQSKMDMQFSSDSHPTHKEHSELNMDVLSAGEDGTFTPPGKGTYTFHDHINDQYTGTLVIK